MESPMQFVAQPAAQPAHMTMLDAMMAWEDGNISEGECIHLFQTLVDNGQAWTLQGCYGRQAMALIRAGLVKGRRIAAKSCCKPPKFI